MRNVLTKRGMVRTRTIRMSHTKGLGCVWLCIKDCVTDRGFDGQIGVWQCIKGPWEIMIGVQWEFRDGWPGKGDIRNSRTIDLILIGCLGFPSALVTVYGRDLLLGGS